MSAVVIVGDIVERAFLLEAENHQLREMIQELHEAHARLTDLLERMEVDRQSQADEVIRCRSCRAEVGQ